MRTWESSETPKILEFNFKGQNTSPWGVLYIIRKVSKCRCRKWPCMSHLDIFNTSYGKKKGQKSNWQFDFRLLKVGNWPNPGVRRWNATHHYKALKGKYKFFLVLIPIGGLSKELWARKVPGVQTKTISGLLLESPGTKSHLDVGVAKRQKKYHMGEGGGFPRIWAMVNLVSPGSPMACPNTKSAPKSDLSNLLVGLIQVWVSK
jgi:hypothetical protein